MSIAVRGLWKRFGEFTALRDVSLHVEPGELVALLGPSGSGKTTLLRLIAGLEHPDGGSISFDGEDASARSARERRVGFVFQHYALFRHMNVFENVAFGLRVQQPSAFTRLRLAARTERLRLSEAQIRARVHELLELVQLEGLARRMPTQLSGGQRQRVALARALAVQPRVLLLDEPFGALDARVRRELRRWLRRLHDELGITSLFVTHDQEEALDLADRVVVVNEGRIEQVGSPEEIYRRPATPFVFGFLGEANWLDTKVDGRRARVGFRPDEIELSREPYDGQAFPARVQRVRSLGPRAALELVAQGGTLLQAEVPSERVQSLHLEPGSEVFATPRELRVFFEDGSST
jgi:sulfate transport system ATP-binding protein